MARQQVLHLEPSNELRFRGPFTDVVTSSLKLTNPEERKVLFKVKTTAPKRYCVRPNSGIIEPGAYVTVAVMLQPFEYDPSERNKHKFMVQTLFAPDGPIESQEELWKEVTPDNLMDSKLKCVFELPVDNSHISSPPSVKTEEDKPTKPVKQVQLESSPPTKATSQDAEFRKSLEDKHRLEKEVLALRDQISTLKENEVRLRKVAMSDTVKSTPAPSAMLGSSSSQVEGLALPPILYLIIALVIGFIIGKLIL